MNTTLRTIFIALAFSVSSVVLASASECTSEELQAKATEAATAMQALAAKNPYKMQKIAERLQEIQTSAATSNGDYSELCERYEALLRDIEG